MAKIRLATAAVNARSQVQAFELRAIWLPVRETPRPTAKFSCFSDRANADQRRKLALG